MRDRTADLLRARQALSQLSYSPISVGLTYETVIKTGIHRFVCKETSKAVYISTQRAC